MKQIIGYIRGFAREVNKTFLLLASCFIAVLIYLNFAKGLEQNLITGNCLPYSLITGHWLVYCIAYYIPLILCFCITKPSVTNKVALLILILIAPILFTIKVALYSDVLIGKNDEWTYFWNEIFYWPSRCLILLLLLYICKVAFARQDNFLGLHISKSLYRPYFIMVLLMMPLITLAATQPDFLRVYPKLHTILPLPSDAHPSGLYKILYELGYGSDFLSIEVFFRGFLVVGMSRYLGKHAIIPMACFYCSIHFGKPLAECISSYFGGLLLGIVSYHSRSIYGGLIVHLGIAWLMELGGYLGRLAQ